MNPEQQPTTAKELIEKLFKALWSHHQHDSDSLVVFFEQDGKPIEISTDLGDAYSESELCENTSEALPLAHSQGYGKK